MVIRKEFRPTSPLRADQITDASVLANAREVHALLERRWESFADSGTTDGTLLTSMFLESICRERWVGRRAGDGVAMARLVSGYLENRLNLDPDASAQEISQALARVGAELDAEVSLPPRNNRFAFVGDAVAYDPPVPAIERIRDYRTRHPQGSTNTFVSEDSAIWSAASLDVEARFERIERLSRVESTTETVAELTRPPVAIGDLQRELERLGAETGRLVRDEDGEMVLTLGADRVVDHDDGPATEAAREFARAILSLRDHVQPADMDSDQELYYRLKAFNDRNEGRSV